MSRKSHWKKMRQKFKSHPKPGRCCMEAVIARDARWLRALGTSLNTKPSDAIAAFKRSCGPPSDEERLVMDKMRPPAKCVVITDGIGCKDNAIYCIAHPRNARRQPKK